MTATMPMIQAAMPSGCGTVTAEAVAAGAGRFRRLAHVGDDVALLFRGQLAVGELGHVLRAGQHRGVDLRRLGAAEIGRVLAGRQRAALAGEVVARRAVQPEQVAAAGDVASEQRLLGDLAVLVARDDRSAAVGLYERAERVDLGLVELGGLLRRLGLAAHGGHASGGHLEVDRRITDADEAGAAIRHALQVDAVARHARRVEQLLAGAQQCRLGLIGDGHLRCRSQRGRQTTRDSQSDKQQHRPRQATAQSAALQCRRPPGSGVQCRRPSGSGRLVGHRTPSHQTHR